MSGENMKKLEPFRVFVSTAVPIDIANCDTDQIIPARFLRKDAGDPDYARYFLHDLRFNADGSEKDFVLNTPAYRDGKILVTDKNWGCGSSREAAVAALAANAVRAVIAPSFGDIHYNNCIKNGVLPIRLPTSVCDILRAQLHDSPGAEIAIDLDAQSLTAPDQTTHGFEIDAFDKHRLLNGLDDIGVTMEYNSRISDFIERYRQTHNWLP